MTKETPIRRGMVFVSYYGSDLGAVLRDLRSFDHSADVNHHRWLLVDNSGKLPKKQEPGVEIIRGTNEAWEFSGWIEGLEACRNWSDVGTVTLLNDSYQRNWRVTTASRRAVGRMFQQADAGKISGWLDNFSWCSKPILSRRPNSRLVVLSASQRPTMIHALRAAIARMRDLISAEKPLFDASERRRVERWLESQSGRWRDEDLPGRLKRIFIEHHMFDAVPEGALSFFPKTRAGSVLYAITRRILGEPR